MFTFLNSAVHPVISRSKKGRIGRRTDRPTLMLISASNSKNEVNKFNVSAIVVREGRGREERQMPQKCSVEQTDDATWIGSRYRPRPPPMDADETFSLTKKHSSSNSDKTWVLNFARLFTSPNWAAPPTKIGQMMHCGYIITLPSLLPLSCLPQPQC